MPSATAGTRPSRRRQLAPRARGSRIEQLQHGLAVALRSGRMPAFVVVAGCLVLLYGFLLSGDFRVASVVVRGTHLGDPAEVVTTADAIGEPIFTIDASESAERVARLPYVEHVTVRTRFPDEVVISVVERVPVVTWQVGTRAFLIDAAGHVLAESGRSELPLVRVEGEPPAVGGSVPSAQVATVVAVQDAFGGRVDELRWTRRDGLVARLTDKRVVIFGDAARVPLKLAVYAEMTRRSDPWTILDLREPDRPYYK